MILTSLPSVVDASCHCLGALAPGDVLLFWSLLCFVLLALLALCFSAFWRMKDRPSLSPYSGEPLRHAIELSNHYQWTINRFLNSLKQYDNRPIRFSKASFCRKTGRIFPESVDWLGRIRVDWNFLQKRSPGNYLSWGSLALEQQTAIASFHGPLDHFQLLYGSSDPSPAHIEKSIALAAPGPLYVDIETRVLLGWVVVPSTPFEVLIVQRPLTSFSR